MFVAFLIAFVALGGLADRRAEARREEAERQMYIETVKSCTPPELRGEIPPAFSTDGGFRDHWRVPTVYPWSVVLIMRRARGGRG